MAIMKGLATFELLKVGGFIFVLVLLLCCCVGLSITSYKTYSSTDNCNITVNSDQSEIVTYYVNNQKYTQTIKAKSSPPSSGSSNNVLSPQYPLGSCTIYYNDKNPNEYSIGAQPSNAAYFFLAISGCICCLLVVSILYFAFLNTHKEVAGVIGGITGVQDIARII
jgi:hypothetical protein